MPRNQGTSRKGKPGRLDRLAGLGKALQKAQHHPQTGGAGGSQQHHHHQPKPNGKSQGGGGMQRQPGVASIGVVAEDSEAQRTKKSVLEMSDLDDFLTQAALAGQEFASEREGLVVLDSTASAYRGPSSVQWQDQQPQQQSVFEFKELSVPRRPGWNSATSKEELDARERQSFLEWRRGIAAAEAQLLKSQQQNQSNDSQTQQQPTISVTPFEKNLEVWRQLWRVLERSSCVLQLADARNPLFYLSKDLRDYAAQLNKPMMVLVNKSDYLTAAQRRAWRAYLQKEGWTTVLFFSAVWEQEKLDRAAAEERRKLQELEHLRAAVGDEDDENINRDGGSDMDDDPEAEVERVDDEEEEEDKESEPKNDPDEKEVDREFNQKEKEDDEHQQKQIQTSDVNNDNEIDDDGTGVNQLLTRQQLLDAMLAFARQHNCQPDPRYDGRIQFGFIGFPNVGKSSVINVLVGSSKHTHGLVRVAVASQPGKTKHFQTLLINDEMMLCDCPGLVFPSFVSNTADLIAAGVYPIAQMRDHWPVVSLICQRIPRAILDAQYGIHLPVPTAQELRERGYANDCISSSIPPPTAEELLTTYCVARSFMAAGSGIPDFQRAARFIIKDYAVGRLLYCHAPPDCADDLPAFYEETVTTALAQTKKLRDKLQQQQDPQGSSMENEDRRNGNEEEDDSDDAEDDQDLVDADLLELIGESAPSGTAGDDNPHSNNNKHGKSNKKGKTPKQKWGKKDRKNRNKDPYGCHSTPDVSLYGDGNNNGGVVVNAGKYSKNGYTRPTSYPVAR